LPSGLPGHACWFAAKPTRLHASRFEGTPKNLVVFMSTPLKPFYDSQGWQNNFLAIPNWVQSCEFLRTGELSIQIRSDSVLPFFEYIKNHTNIQMKVLLDITAVDYPTRKQRFEVVYHLLSVQYNTRLRVKTSVDEMTALPSIGTIYPTAGWFEREVWDLFGIFFSNHSDLRRILTDYGFEGHPLRKDFPLSGYIEARYDESEKRVLLEPIEMAQDFRFFEFANPWEMK
jgi:NADH/F420H2 dehydrogenase subunit C